MAKFTDDGVQIPDQTPLEVALDLFAPESDHARVKRMIANELSSQAAERGDDTWEEANDFDCGQDDPNPTNYEFDEIQDEFLDYPEFVPPTEEPEEKTDVPQDEETQTKPKPAKQESGTPE